MTRNKFVVDLKNFLNMVLKSTEKNKRLTPLVLQRSMVGLCNCEV